MSADIIYCERAELLHGPNLCLPIVLTSGTNEADVSTWVSMRHYLSSVLLAAPALAMASPPHAPVTFDPPSDTTHPASLAAFVIPSFEGALNAVMYTAAGIGAHPTLLLLHGFPGNEQNVDLAQAARRAGWNVLTFHCRGSWGSPGAFSFAHCAEDAATALAYLRRPEVVAKYGIDPARIAVAGHSMGGMMAARIAAGDAKVIGAFPIDPADFVAIGRSFAHPKQRESFRVIEVRGDMPPLAGTSEEAILSEVAHAGATLDLVATVPALAGRPLALIGAKRGIGFMAEAAATAARKAGVAHLETETLVTDHSFSDMRIALSNRLVDWLTQFQR